MCGIVGFWNAELAGQPARSLLERMCAAISHRGPDDQGVLVSPPVGLGMRRLSIIDVAGGHQPIGNEDGSVQVVFNGEIYNYVALKDELTKRGHVFRSKSDTEVISHAYEEYGLACFEHLWGMFAIAIWDAPRQLLVLARDRFGKKPLFYYHRGSRLLFASEIKAILQDVDVPREVDPVALDQYFTYGYVPGPLSIFRGFRKLPPGSFLTFSRGSLQVRRYWSLEPRETCSITEDEAIEHIRSLLEDAVRSRLMSDVPLGAFLSGGVDSSAVVAYMARFTSEPVKTFSIGFEEKDYSELQYARQAAEAFGTEHHEAVVRPDVVGLLPDLVWAFDEPFADESMLPTYYVSRLARQHVVVALSGDGGDEAFGGYWRYVHALRDAQTPAMPRPVLQLASSMSALMPEGMRGKTRLRALSMTPELRYVDMSAIFQRQTKPALYTLDLQENLAEVDAYSVQMERFASAGAASFLSRMQYVDIGTYLAEDILTKVDRASMWTSLEVRAPLLDHRLVEFTLSLPPSYLVRGTGKYIFKQALRGIVPEAILERRKMGFGVPLEHWFRGELEPFARDLLLDGSLGRRGYVSPSYVNDLFRLHLSGRANNSRKLWALLCFEMWCRTYLDQSPRRLSTPAYAQV